jgi:hypothetical protein
LDAADEVGGFIYVDAETDYFGICVFAQNASIGEALSAI